MLDIFHGEAVAMALEALLCKHDNDCKTFQEWSSQRLAQDQVWLRHD